MLVFVFYGRLLLVVVGLIGYGCISDNTGGTGSLPLSELTALTDLYIATQGISWSWTQPFSTNGYPWNISADYAILSDPCSSIAPWQGVTCTCGTACHVSQLVLTGHGLDGEAQ
jgi:hypothetical protein